MLKPVVLVVLDGWGIGKNGKGNAIAQANLPTIEKLNNFYPHLALQASGISVGLLWGEPGNSEAGHKTIGSGKIIYQSLPRIMIEIQNGEFFKNEALLNAMKNAQQHHSALHLMGLVGEGAVHSSLDHLYALLEFAKEQKIERIYLHLFTDGRDSSPEAGVTVIKKIQEKISASPNIRIATLSGRYFAMDRNNNWDRIQKAYDAMIEGKGIKITDPIDYLKESYAKKIFDEYLEPAVVIGQDGQPIGNIQNNDSLIFFNFREDRAKQITKALILPGFMKFKRKEIQNLHFTAMTRYEEGLPIDVAYGPTEAENSLGQMISRQNLFQLRIAETEKFAHVTYFFNGGAETAFPREDRIIIPSPIIDRFDKVPEMSAQEVTDKVIDALGLDKYSFILINYANADIVGHTGNGTAVVKAVETIDKCLARLIPAVLQKDGCLLITADHGNAESVEDSLTGEINTEHSVNPVPLWFVTGENHSPKHQDSTDKNGQGDVKTLGLITDIAPTILDLLQIPQPKEMTGESLLSLLK